MPARAVAQRFDAVLEGRSRRRALEHLCRPRRDPLLSAAQRAAAQRLLRPGGDRRQGRGGARRLQDKLEKVLAEEFPSVVGARLSARARAAGRLAGAVSRQRARHRARCARSRSSSAQIVADEPASRSTSTSTGSSRRGKVRIRIDQDEARLLGLSSQALASVLNTVISGSPDHAGPRRHLSRRRRGARHRRAARLARRRCARCRCRCRTAAPCRSSQFATFEYEQDYPLIWRRDRVPTLTVQADVAPGVLPETVVAALAPPIESSAQDACRAGYRIAVGGTVEESAKSQASVHRRGAGDAAHHAHGPDVPAAELPAPVHRARASRRSG